LNDAEPEVRERESLEKEDAIHACEVSIGGRCVLGPNVSIYTVSVSTDPEIRARNMGLKQARPIVIEEDCWIGGGATIIPGRTIQKGSTVGAGSVVTKVCTQTRYAVIVSFIN
jgi:acetyltransferase-like isoleucine patch superfamily enzyme